MNAILLCRMGIARSVGYRLYSTSLMSLSTVTPAVDKMYDILHAYRIKNYSREIPSRFVKDVLKFTDENNDGTMEYAEFKQFLENIGAGDQMNQEEIEDVFNYVGGESAADGEIPIETMQKVLIDDLRARLKR